MDEFDFDDIDDQVPKKPNPKNNQSKQPLKKYHQILNIRNNKIQKNDDFYDLQIQDKPKPKQSKLNNLSDDYLDSDTDNNYSKPNNKKTQKFSNKENESTLPKININKSPRNSQQKVVKNKMDLSLQELPEKRAYIGAEKSPKNKRNQQVQEEFDYMQVNKKQSQSLPKSSLKTNVSPLKEKMPPQIQKPVQKTLPLSQKPTNKDNSKDVKKVENNKKIQQQSQEQDYEELYEQEIFDDQKPEQKVLQKNKKKEIKDKTNDNTTLREVKNAQKNSPPTHKRAQSKDKKSVRSQKEKQQPVEQKNSKYQQLVSKSFPNDQDQQKIQKLKPDAINRLNQKMREMIKGFSKELTDMIDKNLILLRKPQNQIKEQIEGQIDPIQAQVKLLQEMKKNNQKIIDNAEKQLQNITKTSEKISSSAETNAQMTQQIEAYKKQISMISRENSNLRNEIQKQGKKVTKIEQNSKPSLGEDSKYKNVIQMTQKLANHKLQFDKNRKKLSQLEQKLSGLEDKIAQIAKKRNKIYQKAQNEGISFHTKEQKKRYDELKKKRDQHQLFESKFKSSIKSKQTVIQHEMTDIEVVIAEYEKRFELLNDDVQNSKLRIFAQINKAKKNPKLPQNTRQILTQLQLFMSDDNPNRTQQDQNALNLISNNIYKKQYQLKGHSKTLSDQKSDKKVEYKNYLQEVSRQNEQARRKKSTTERKISQHNPFRKAVTPNQSVQQVSLTVQKMNKTKQPQAEVDKQKQRVWKSSNTQVLLRNPLKRPNDKGRYEEIKEQANPLENKEIMKLINKNKEKITLKQQQTVEKQESQASILANKKPFVLKTSAKQQAQQLNELAGISKQMQKIGQEIESHRNSLQRESKHSNYSVEYKNVEVKLKEHHQSLSLQPTVDLKPASNTTPFKNFRLKKDKQNENQPQTQKINEQKKIDTKLSLSPKQQIKETINTSIVAQDTNPFKPKRFNLRKKNDNQSQSYVPSARNIENNISINNAEQRPQVRKDISINIPEQQNKIKRNNQPIQYQLTENKKQKDEAFDPFKKFMINQKQQERSISLHQQTKKQSLKIDNNDKQPEISIKPRMNLFKKGNNEETSNNSQKLILLGDAQKDDKINHEKVINPYAQVNNQQQQQFEVPKIQRQGRLKKMNPPANSNKPVNKNIFADVQDATISANIKVLGDPQPPKREPQLYVPKSINNDKELNVNDLLGIKKKNFQVDKDLLLDLPGDNKISIRGKAKGKANDFFGDMDL